MSADAVSLTSVSVVQLQPDGELKVEYEVSCSNTLQATNTKTLLNAAASASSPYPLGSAAAIFAAAVISNLSNNLAENPL